MTKFKIVALILILFITSTVMCKHDKCLCGFLVISSMLAFVYEQRYANGFGRRACPCGLHSAQIDAELELMEWEKHKGR